MLARMYNSIKRSIFQQFTGNEETIKANQLQEFLRVIKRAQRLGGIANLQSSDFSAMWSIAEQQSVLEALQSIHPQIFSNKYFISTSSSSYELGEYLEMGIAQIVKGFGALATGNEYDSFSSKVGSGQTQIPDLINGVDEVARQTLLEVYQETSKQLHQYQSNNPELERYAKFIPSVSGKIDNVGLSAEIQVRSEVVINPVASTIIDALKGATFTDKNYISTDHLKFGITNPFRVFMTVSNGDVGRYARMLNCFIYHVSLHPMAPTYFYRIRALYELTGYGMQYTTSAMQELLNGKVAKYLIWNNPITDEIHVISTKQIIQQIIDQTEEIEASNYRDALFGTIEIKQGALNFA